MKLLSRWFPAIIWMIVIFLLSSRQSVTISSEYVLNFLFFKTLHVMEYAILYVFLYRAVRHPFYAFVLTMAYALTDEIHQTMVPTREGKPRDVIIDSIGATLAWIFIVKLLPIMPKKLQKLV